MSLLNSLFIVLFTSFFTIVESAMVGISWADMVHHGTFIKIPDNLIALAILLGTYVLFFCLLKQVYHFHKVVREDATS